jgi:hypothetical protein
MGRKRSRSVRRGEAQWAEILRRFKTSGLAAQAFCGREGLALSSLQRWQRRLRSTPAGKFVEIIPSPPARSAIASWSLEVSLPNGVSLKFQA